MNKNYRWILLVLPLTLIGYVSADNKPMPKSPATAKSGNQPVVRHPAPVGLDDNFIEQQKAQLDKIIQRRAEMEKKRPAAMTTGPGAQLQKERMDFENKMLNDRRALMDTLKATPQEARQKVWQEFQMKQSADRKAFMDSQKPAIDAVNKERLEKRTLTK